jgi:hypothetical protein
MIACQIVIMVLLLAGLLNALHRDINGIKARPPLGFAGVIISLTITALMAWVYWKAGAFSELF